MIFLILLAILAALVVGPWVLLRQTAVRPEGRQAHAGVRLVAALWFFLFALTWSGLMQGIHVRLPQLFDVWLMKGRDPASMIALYSLALICFLPEKWLASIGKLGSMIRKDRP